MLGNGEISLVELEKQDAGIPIGTEMQPSGDPGLF
jgi:hypothetical protein